MVMLSFTELQILSTFIIQNLGLTYGRPSPFLEFVCGDTTAKVGWKQAGSHMCSASLCIAVGGLGVNTYTE